MKHLDRALCNPSWYLLFEETTVLHLPKTSSDHHPIFINSSPSNLLHANRPFRLETIWFSDLLFPKIIQDSWNSHSEDAILALKDFTNKIRIWNRNVFGNIFQKKKSSRSAQRHPDSSLLQPLSLPHQFGKKYQHRIPTYPKIGRRIMGYQI